MKLDFETVEVTGLLDTTVKMAVVGDTTVLIVTSYTGEMSVAGFKSPLLEIMATAFSIAAESVHDERLGDPTGLVAAKTAESATLSDLQVEPPDVMAMKIIELRSELKSYGIAPPKSNGRWKLRQLVKNCRKNNESE